MPLSCLPPAPVVAAVWSELWPLRDFAHGPRRCPTSAARAAALLAGTPVPRDCEGCYDLLVDCLTLLPDRPVRPAYVRTVARHLAADRMRQANAALHGVSRPDRRDGAVGRVRAALTDQPDGTWLDTLLTLVLRAASTRGPVPVTTWPLAAFAEARARHTTSPGSVRREVDVVLATAERVAGRDWVDAYVHAPLRARSAAYGALRLDDPETPDVPDTPTADAPLTAAFWARLSGDAPAALRAAATAVTGRIPTTRDAARAAAELVADLPDLCAAHQARHGRPTATDVRAAVARHCADPSVGAALDDATVSAALTLLHQIPLHQVPVGS